MSDHLSSPRSTGAVAAPTTVPAPTAAPNPTHAPDPTVDAAPQSAVAPESAVGPERAEGRRPDPGSWAARYRFWDVYFGLVTLGVAGFLAVDGSEPVPQRFAVLLPLAALTAWYVSFGRRLMRDELEDWRGYAYLAGALALYVPAVLLDGSASFVLFALGPQAYMVATAVPATVAVVAFNSVHLLVLLGRDVEPGEVASGPLPVAVLAVLLTAVLGTWSRRVVAQSQERARLIDELARSQAEVARLSHEAGVLAERQRLAGEIHDTIAQGLTSVVLLLQAADADVDGDPERAHRHLALAARTARENLTDTRELIAALTPAALTGSSLTDALTRLVARFTADAGIATDFRCVGDPVPLPTPTEVMLLRAAQESLTNVRKHAEARTASVRLDFRPDRVVLTVTDDGRGLAAPAAAEPASGGYGLTAMRARVAQVSGVLTVGPGLDGEIGAGADGPAGTGTTVRVEVPA
ncbi:sensor histidine kinase [Plantactinospora endophytica]|uniref:Two-component sensor histidine kinase n=1 Tax=Plantactinospora endophytica TaxID=673535 RepID=A0ABQ4E0S7_9ACTN|nr:sensor histidine kinase [Plantactinospora endophytica]GIG88318.1 two-component sensor histidine kinase [Plantactinospora endophytica]